ncbi:MAG: glycosyltransferase [Micropruina sp.]|uniref:glycosyltransferase family 2 protein n=1 Tax=Micropruina sp. TaxID=2737536 RepID=UPI0039E6A188
MSVTIGVVVPVYRVERYVAGCIASIGAQTLAPDRVILVDDRGGDASMQRALAAAKAAGLPVETLTQPENRGLSAARNAGLARLDTDLVWFCDSDDTVEPEFLQAMRDALLAADAQLAMCRTARVDEAGATLSIDEDAFDRATMSGAELARRLLLSEARGYACNKLFRRELLGDAPFPEGHVYEDVAPMLRIALATERVALVDAPLYRYLINENVHLPMLRSAHPRPLRSGRPCRAAAGGCRRLRGRRGGGLALGAPPLPLRRGDLPGGQHGAAGQAGRRQGTGRGGCRIRGACPDPMVGTPPAVARRRASAGDRRRRPDRQSVAVRPDPALALTVPDTPDG